MIHMYNLWNVTQDPTTGLYHRTPLLDAQEFSLPGYIVGGPNMGMVEQWNSMQNNYSLIDNGPQTYRISFNSYMVSYSDYSCSNPRRVDTKPPLACIQKVLA